MRLQRYLIAVGKIVLNLSFSFKLIMFIIKFMTEWYGPKPQQSPDLGRVVNERNFLRLKNILDRTKGSDFQATEILVCQLRKIKKVNDVCRANCYRRSNGSEGSLDLPHNPE